MDATATKFPDFVTLLLLCSAITTVAPPALVWTEYDRSGYFEVVVRSSKTYIAHRTRHILLFNIYEVCIECEQCEIYLCEVLNFGGMRYCPENDTIITSTTTWYK